MYIYFCFFSPPKSDALVVRCRLIFCWIIWRNPTRAEVAKSLVTNMNIPIISSIQTLSLKRKKVPSLHSHTVLLGRLQNALRELCQISLCGATSIKIAHNDVFQKCHCFFFLADECLAPRRQMVSPWLKCLHWLLPMQSLFSANGKPDTERQRGRAIWLLSCGGVRR